MAGRPYNCYVDKATIDSDVVHLFDVPTSLNAAPWVVAHLATSAMAGASLYLRDGGSAMRIAGVSRWLW